MACQFQSLPSNLQNSKPKCLKQLPGEFFERMGLKKNSSPWWVFLFWASWNLCYYPVHADGDDSQEVLIAFQKVPLVITSETSHKFVFEVSEGGNGYSCRNCSIKCKLDDHASTGCEAREVLYTNLGDGNHKFEVCANGSEGVQCASHNWTVDTVPPTAYVTAATSFTSAVNISVNITFSEPCTGGGGFRCSSVNDCNHLQTRIVLGGGYEERGLYLFNAGLHSHASANSLIFNHENFYC